MIVRKAVADGEYHVLAIEVDDSDTLQDLAQVTHYTSAELVQMMQRLVDADLHDDSILTTLP